MTVTQSNSQNNLMSKVVLLIGNDVNVLHPLAIGFAKNGCDIALASSRMPSEIANTIREGVQAVGRRFLFLDKALMNIRKAELAVAEIKRELGGIDFLVDMSKEKTKQRTNQLERQTRWWLSKIILQEIKN